MFYSVNLYIVTSSFRSISIERLDLKKSFVYIEPQFLFEILIAG